MIRTGLEAMHVRRWLMAGQTEAGLRSSSARECAREIHDFVATNIACRPAQRRTKAHSGPERERLPTICTIAMK